MGVGVKIRIKKRVNDGADRFMSSPGQLLLESKFCRVLYLFKSRINVCEKDG
jgi:hypothetical protein